LQGGIEGEISVGIVGLQRKTTLFAMNIALDVQIVDLRYAEQEVGRAGEVFGGERD
jgi:curli biogenesis system outer membrane secretion channel CsgG